MTNDSSIFESMPKFDPSTFQPPAWATGPAFDFTRKNGESSKSGFQSAGTSPSSRQRRGSQSSFKSSGTGEMEDEDEVWEDARDDLEDAVEETDEGLRFTTHEMKRLVGLALELKDEGNKAYTAKPPNYTLATEKYEAALKHLPPLPKRETPPPKPTPSESGIQEITDEEAETIQQEDEVERTPEEVERAEVEDQIRELGKACHGNLAACWAALKEDKKAVEACNKALELDPTYAKAIHRRATANDRIGSWSSLTSAKQDYEKLLETLPRSSPQYTSIRTALATLPRRIAAQQDKEKDEMIGQLKELGNGILGKFGLSTDMFKFEQQEGGGYGLKFER